MNAPTVLVTGATGLIGRRMPAALRAAGFRVIAASRGGQAVDGAEGLAMDCLDPASVRTACARAGADHLVHLAWHDGARDRWTSPANFSWIAATLDLIAQFAAAGGRRAVLVGSCAEYDWSRAGEGAFSETASLRPATLYGEAKAATGIAAVAGAGALGLSLAWARPFFCFGPGEPEGRLVGDLVAGLSAGRAVDCTDGLQRRDFLETGELARALAALLGSPATGAVNIASGEAIEVRRLILAFARAIGRDDLVRLGTRTRPADDPALIAADVSRLRDEVGFHPSTDIEAGVRATLSTFAGTAQ